MNLQVILNRVIALVLGSSIYSFGIVLLAFLLGIALGSAVASALVPRITRPFRALAITQFGAVVSLVALYLYIDHLSLWFGSLILAWFPDYGAHVTGVKLLMFVIALAVSLPPTVFLGATFPLTVKAVVGDTRHVGEEVGRLYAVNTIGAILGSFISAFVLLPVMSRIGGGRGMEISLMVSLALHGFAAIITAFADQGRKMPRYAFITAACIGLLLFGRSAPLWNQSRLTMGLFRMSMLKHAIESETWKFHDIVYCYDGITTTVSVNRLPVSSTTTVYALKNNGKSEASNTLTDMTTQIMVSAFPILMHPRGSEGLDVVIIGFGSGVTVGSALEFPVRKVDVVEYEPAVVQASYFFGRFEEDVGNPDIGPNHLVYRRETDPRTGLPNPAYDWGDPDTFVVNPRLKILSNDGRNFLGSTPERYDVIISEPSNPWITGVSNLFTLEHFKAANQALRDDGIFCQWVQLYELSPEMVKVIYRTFAEAFPYIMVFSPEKYSTDTILVGSRRPMHLDVGRLEREFERTEVRMEMRRVLIQYPMDIPALLLFASREEVLDYTGKAPINTDDNLLVEFRAPNDLIGHLRFGNYISDVVYGPRWPYGRVTPGLLQGSLEGRQKGDVYLQLAFSMLREQRRDEARRFADLATSQRLSVETIVARSIRLLTSDGEVPGSVWSPAVSRPDVDASTGRYAEEGFRMAREAVESDRPGEALSILEGIPQCFLEKSGPGVKLLWAEALSRAPESEGGDCRTARSLLEEMLTEDPGFVLNHPEVYLFLGRCYERTNRVDQAEGLIETYVRLTSGQPLAR